MKTIITNGRIIDPAQNLDAPGDVIIEAGLIKALTESGQVKAAAGDTVIEARNRWITPGLIDMHVHFREPGQEYKETLATGARAAAFGGFSTVLTMPNTSPPLDNAGLVSEIMARGRRLESVRVLAAAAITRGRRGEELTEYADLKAAGAAALSDDGSWVARPEVMRRALEYAQVCALPVLSHAEDPGLSKGGAVNEGRVSTRLGLAGIPAAAEVNAVFRDISLAELTGCPLHLCHLSTAGAVELVREAKRKGLPVTAETAPHYLFLTEEAVLGYNVNAKMNPPLRTPDDQAALRAALKDGTLDVIATDHAPHSVLEKELEFAQAAFGIIGLETALPLMLKLTANGLISPSRLVELMSLNPARILGLPLGSLQPGRAADLTVIDPGLKWIFSLEDLRSKSVNTPFIGQDFTGKAVMTIVGGRAVYDAEQPGQGPAVRAG